MIKIKKDMISRYMLGNLVGTLIVALVSFVTSLILYYQCSLLEALQRVFVYDIYTTFYFILIWVFDYLIFEISKILYDIYEEKVTFLPCIGLVVIAVGVNFLPILNMFQYNLSLLCFLIVLRMIKEMYKRTPELFRWMKKRPGSGLE